jgi:hypothetical protein
VDDPFFVDLGGAFDLGDIPRQTSPSREGVARYNVHTIALQIDISTLQKNGKTAAQASNILDPDYVIGVWASASRQAIRTLSTANGGSPFDPTGGGTFTEEGPWVQVSRLGMPLTNEVINPIGVKDQWNFQTPYQDLANNGIYGDYYYNPELALYMDDTKFGPAVPAMRALRIQSNSLGMFDFRNGANGLFALKNTPAVAGTALDDAVFGSLLLPGPGKPRSVDLWPIFHTGVPNMRPYQLATGKGGNPLAAGKPFVNNFLPNGGDMLRLNMAVPPTPRNSADFSSLGLIQAAVLGLTDARFNTSTALQPIPNMDGFPNGRRLEDDVTRIELQTVGGVVLAAIGLSYENPARLGQVLGYTTGVERNDTTFRTTFPYEQTPWPGTCDCAGLPTGYQQPNILAPSVMRLAAPEVFMMSAPNPTSNNTTIRYRVESRSMINIEVYDAAGNKLTVLVNQTQDPGSYSVMFNAASLPSGVYMIKAVSNGVVKQALRVVKN